MQNYIEAFLDIETTGLSPECYEITVVGIYLSSGIDSNFIQLVGEKVTADNVLAALKGVKVLYTYNGDQFDLPFIHARLGINLANSFTHCDLMYDCWKNNLYGGLKYVEKQLGIHRQSREIDGSEAARLWWRYVNDYDENALTMLLEYNKEDVINLRTLKEKLL